MHKDIYDRPTAATSYGVTSTNSGRLLQIIGPNPKRAALVISAIGGSSICLILGNGPFVAAGIPMGMIVGGTSLSTNLVLSREVIGRAICEPLYLVDNTVSMKVAVTEITAP